MPAVTEGGIAYPLGTDQARTWPATAQQAAQGTDQALQQLRAEVPRMQSGSVALTEPVASGAFVTVDVAFPEPFAVPPVVLVETNSGRLNPAVIAAPTVDGVRLGFNNWSGGSASGVVVSWVAVQVGA